MSLLQTNAAEAFVSTLILPSLYAVVQFTFHCALPVGSFSKIADI